VETRDKCTDSKNNHTEEILHDQFKNFESRHPRHIVFTCEVEYLGFSSTENSQAFANIPHFHERRPTIIIASPADDMLTASPSPEPERRDAMDGPASGA
jgi:hypothetical protein